MARLEEKGLVRFLKSDYNIKGASDFVKKSERSLLEDKRIQAILDDSANDQERNQKLATLEGLTKTNFEPHQEYLTHNSKVSQGARYLGLTAIVGGAITGITGALALVAAPALSVAVAAGATLYYGLAAVGIGVAANEAADAYESVRSAKASVTEDSNYKTLQLVEKSDDGLWKKVANKAKAIGKGIKDNVVSIGEGLAENAATLASGPGLAYLTGNPYSQAAAIPLAAVAFYRGNRKFKDKIIAKIHKATIDDFVELYQSQPVETPSEEPSWKIPENPDPDMVYANNVVGHIGPRTSTIQPSLEFAHTPHQDGYALSQPQEGKVVGYVGPRTIDDAVDLAA
tara:strand:+ start:1879 stop:2904 length:1026 start_codon:yes stop_codon:yes gene_type:complete